MTTCTPSCRGVMEIRLGGSRLDCAEMSVHQPRRGSATSGWMAASSPSKSKVRIDPPKSMGQSLADSDSSESEYGVSVTSRNEEQTYGRSPKGHLFRPCGSWVPPESF